jgi:hypothetical protein
MDDPTASPHFEGRFLPEVEQVLRESGWFPGRVAPLSQLKQWLIIDEQIDNRGLQCRMFPAAWRVLHEFGGLLIHQDASGASLSRKIFSFDPSEVALQVWIDGWFIEEFLCEGALFPLGMWGEPSDSFAVGVTGQGNDLPPRGSSLGG